MGCHLDLGKVYAQQGKIELARSTFEHLIRHADPATQPELINQAHAEIGKLPRRR